MVEIDCSGNILVHKFNVIVDGEIEESREFTDYVDGWNWARTTKREIEDFTIGRDEIVDVYIEREQYWKER